MSEGRPRQANLQRSQRGIPSGQAQQPNHAARQHQLKELGFHYKVFLFRGANR
jgi:hypothetical protein